MFLLHAEIKRKSLEPNPLVEHCCRNSTLTPRHFNTSTLTPPARGPATLTLCQKYYFNGGRHFNAYLQNSYFNGAAL